MIQLTFEIIKRLFRRLLPFLLVLLSVYAIFMISSSYEPNSAAELISSISLIALVLLCGVGMFYLYFTLWQEMQSLFYGPRAYLIRTLPLSRMQIYGAYLLSGLAALLCGLILPFVFLYLKAGDELSPLIEAMPRETAIMAFTLFAQGVLYWVSGIFGLVFGHIHGKSNWGIIIGLGLLWCYASQGVALLFMYLSHTDLLAMENPSMEYICSILLTGVLTYFASDIICILLCGWRIQRAAEVE